MKTAQELRDEVEFQLGCARLWDAVASWPLMGRAPLDATLRAVAHRECAKALERRLKVRKVLYGAYLLFLVVIAVGVYAAVV